MPAIESPADLVQVRLDLFVVARIGLRAVSRVLAVLATPWGLRKPPCPHTVINWGTRLSSARLQDAPALPTTPVSADPFAKGCIWIIASSIALGSGKILAVVALDARHHHLHATAPGLGHVQPLAVAVAESWTGESVADVLQRVRLFGNDAQLIENQ